MKLLAKHIVLAAGESCEESRTQVLHFFEKSSLVRYDKIVSRQNRSIPATDPNFSKDLAQAIERNREILAGFIKELDAANNQNLVEIGAITQGYQSKILHIIAHFLDGFIGIDSAFYNLVDDSHWLPEQTGVLIEEKPENHWLFFLDGYSMSPKEAALLHM